MGTLSQTFPRKENVNPSSPSQSPKRWNKPKIGVLTQVLGPHKGKLMEEERGTLKVGEPHPAAKHAVKYLATLPYGKLYTYLEAFSSCAIEGNRMGEVCANTLNRLLKNEPISDRYLLGVAWYIKEMEEKS